MEVYLAIYDLSQGMARNLSAQFLGPNHAIDMIPHTALLVFGQEYFFGGGIQSVDPHYFRSMTGRWPVQTERLGTTHVSRSEFDAWCQQTAATKYNAGTYDLLNRNCNHFSHDAALLGLKLPKGVPSWILEVPQKFLSSPMGQLVRPLLDQMQITQMSPVQALPRSIESGPTEQVSATTATSVAGCQNPWASMHGETSSTSTTLQGSPGKPMAVSGSMTPGAGRSITPSIASNSEQKSILRKYTKPLLSNDTKSLTLCASKLAPHLNDATQLALGGLSKALIQEQNPHLAQHLVDTVVPEIWKLIQEEKVVSFSLLYLRLVAIHFSQSKAVAACMSELIRTLSFGEHGGCNDSCSSPQTFSTAASKSLAWCVASNYTGSTKQQQSTTDATPEPLIPSSLVEAAIRDWNHDAVQVRQAACTFLYNYVISNGPQLEDDEETVVSLVCSSLESLIEESDPTTRLRRLVVGARVVFGVHHSPTHRKESVEGTGYNKMAKDLIQDLGFISLLEELAATDYDDPASKHPHPDTMECRQLALELIQKFQSCLSC